VSRKIWTIWLTSAPDFLIDTLLLIPLWRIENHFPTTLIPYHLMLCQITLLHLPNPRLRSLLLVQAKILRLGLHSPAVDFFAAVQSQVRLLHLLDSIQSVVWQYYILAEDMPWACNSLVFGSTNLEIDFPAVVCSLSVRVIICQRIVCICARG
jgi:hypothetical protein